MNRSFREGWMRWLLAWTLAAGMLLPALAQTNYLHWRAEKNQIDANIESWTLGELLENIANDSGWDVYVEPDTERAVSSKFQKLSVSEALQRLLGSLNFALVPRTNAAPKLIIFRTSPQDATRVIKPKGVKSKETGAGKRIANELIVTLKPGSKTSIYDLAKRLGAKVIGKAEGLNAYRLQFEDAEAASAALSELSSNPDVASVDNNYVVDRPAELQPLSLSSTPPLGIKPRVTGDPNKIIVGLIDTAVQPQGSSVKDFLLPGLSVADTKATPSPEISHGTSMAETIIRGVAITDDSPSGTPVRILPVDVYGANESTTTFDVGNGIYAALQGGATIINLSLGSSGTTSFVQQIIESAHAQGAIFIGAAGNEPVTTATYPAAYPEVVAVTAGDKAGNVASYANRGSFVDVMAPGANIVQYNDRSYIGQGTSFSTAYVSGVAAGLVSTSGQSLSQVESDVRRRLAYTPKP